MIWYHPPWFLLEVASSSHPQMPAEVAPFHLHIRWKCGCSTVCAGEFRWSCSNLLRLFSDTVFMTKRAFICSNIGTPHSLPSSAILETQETEENSCIRRGVFMYWEVLPQPHSSEKDGCCEIQVDSMNVVLPMVEVILGRQMSFCFLACLAWKEVTSHHRIFEATHIPQAPKEYIQVWKSGPMFGDYKHGVWNNGLQYSVLKAEKRKKQVTVNRWFLGFKDYQNGSPNEGKLKRCWACTISLGNPPIRSRQQDFVWLSAPLSKCIGSKLDMLFLDGIHTIYLSC